MRLDILSALFVTSFIMISISLISRELLFGLSLFVMIYKSICVGGQMLVT